MNRKELAGGNQTFSYLAYALGEIVLVVIGILIAVSIDTWNDEQKSEKTTLSVLKEVQKDLLLNLSEVEDVIAGDRKMDSLLKKVRNGHLTAEDYENSYDLYYAALVFTKIVNYDNGFSKLMGNIDDIPPVYQEAVDQLKLIFEKIAYEIELHEQIIIKVEETHKYLAFNSDWYNSRDREARKKGIEFFLHDPLYKNIATYILSHLDDNNWLQCRNLIIAGYISLSRLTSVNELPEQYQVFQEPNLESYAGVYRYQDSLANALYGEKTINAEDGMLYFNTGSSTLPMYLQAKDTFFYTINHRFRFLRDSSDQVIGVNRNFPIIIRDELIWETMEIVKAE